MLFATTSFVPLAKSIALANGLQDLRMVVIEHPLGGITDDALVQRIDSAHDQLVAMLDEVSGSDLAPAAADASAATAEIGYPAPTRATADADVARVGAILDELRSSLANDGAGLEVAATAAGGIAVEVTFTDETCMNCVIPPPILNSIITDTLQRNGVDQEVVVMDQRAG